MERVKVYDENGAPARGRGLFAAALMERLPLLPVEEEGRLRDARLREHFIARIFARARVREFLASDWGPAELVEFHAREKMLVRVHDPGLALELGRLVAKAGRLDRAELAARYEELHARRSPRRRRRAATRTCSSISPGTSRTRCRAPTGRSCSARSRSTATGSSRSPCRSRCCAATSGPRRRSGPPRRSISSPPRASSGCEAVCRLAPRDDRRHRRPGRRRQEHRRARRRAALGFPYLDSGAMYRTVGLLTLRHGGAASEQAEGLDIQLGERVLANGEDVTEAIRAPEVSEAASKVATNPAVRAALVEKQRELLRGGDWVAEGRDIGTVVAPDAAVKVFLTARPEERARRRAEELGTDVETVLRDQALRDAQDASREHSPLDRARAPSSSTRRPEHR